MRVGTEAASAGHGSGIRSIGESTGQDCHREEMEETQEEGAMLKEMGSATRPLYCRG